MLNAYSVDEIVITQNVSKDDWREPLSAYSISIMGYVNYKTVLIRNIKGEQVTSQIQIYISKHRLDDLLTQALTHEDRIYSINGIVIDKAIMKIDTPKHFSMPHYEIYLA